MPAAEPDDGTRFRILGPLEIRLPGGWTQIRGATQRSLLAVLLLHGGQTATREQLIDQVWDNDLGGQGTLSVHMHRLRKVIGDPDGHVLVTRPHGYQLALKAGALDADRFTRLAASGRQALDERAAPRAAVLLAQALDLWRGPALADVLARPLINAEAYQLDQARIRARVLLARAELSCGHADRVIPELHRLLADQPLQEPVWALLMQALSSVGRQAEALAVYARAREAISGELGVDPGRELQELHQQILRVDCGNAGARAGSGISRVPPAAVGETTSAGVTPGAGSAAMTAAPDPRRPVASRSRASAHRTGALAPGPPRTPERAPPRSSATQVVPDAPGYDSCPDPLATRTAAEFVEALREFRIWAGEPSFRKMAAEAARRSRKAAASTLCQAADGGSLPSLPVVQAFVTGCGGTEKHVRDFTSAWRRLRLPHSTSRPILPGTSSLYPVPDTG